MIDSDLKVDNGILTIRSVPKKQVTASNSNDEAVKRSVKRVVSNQMPKLKHPRDRITPFELMSMNRATRRRIGRANGIKIPGIDLSKKGL